MDTGIRREMEGIYSSLTPGEIPWNNEEPPGILVDLVADGTIKPCNGIDLGCGLGNYSRYLARKGFRMTGVDVSSAAIRLAQEKATAEKLTVSFQVVNLTGNWKIATGPFDFALEFEVLHHIYPEYRSHYMEQLAGHLHPGALYLAVCFHESDPQFGGKGKYRQTSIGTRLYFSSQEELKKLYEPFFGIREQAIIEVSGKRGPHQANFFLLEKK